MPPTDKAAPNPMAADMEKPSTIDTPDVEVDDGGVVPEAAQNTKPSRKSLSLFHGGGGTDKHPEEEKRPDDRTRLWEFTVSVERFMNLTGKPITVFFAMSVGHLEPKKYASQVKLPPKYSGLFRLDKEERVLSEPVILYERKFFKLSYKELGRHVVKIDMWRVSSWTFNEYVGTGSRALQKIACGKANFTQMIKKKLTRKQEVEMKKARRQAPDVAFFTTTINLEEVFDCDLNADNFELVMDEPDPKEKFYRLRFIMPTSRKSLPGTADVSRSCHYSALMVATTPAKGKTQSAFWSSCGRYTFVGTRMNLQSSYFVVQVFEPRSHHVPRSVGESTTMTPVLAMMIGNVGDCLMNLTSVLDIPVFISKVKNFRRVLDARDLAEIRSKYEVGKLSGYVKVQLKSRKLFEESDFVGERPMQLSSNTSVSHLNPAERYLVVQVDKCQGLPAADIDEGTSDPYLRLFWDNMTQTSPTMKETLKPVFKYRAYFPVRFSTKLMKGDVRKEKSRRLLECEMSSEIKLLKIEVFDEDDTSADLLGSASLHMSNILSAPKGMRSLLGKGKDAAEDDEEKIAPDDDAGDDGGEGQWYQKQVKTRVYDGKKTPLSKVHLRNDQAAFVFFEAYFFPDWPEDVTLKREQLTDESKDFWKSRQLEWESRQNAWVVRYKSSFPDSIGGLGCSEGEIAKDKDFRIYSCVASHPLTSETTPLMSFLTPIIIPEDDSHPMRLMHLINSLTFESYGPHLRTGRISGTSWHDSDHVLAKRKGTIWDHAVLLCSMLLGAKKDAYVVKGLVRKQPPGQEADRGHGHHGTMYMEHVWVMTRERGWVTFWEPCIRQLFHLPRRCNDDSVNKEDKSGKQDGGKRSSKKGPKSSVEDKNVEDKMEPDETLELFRNSEVGDVALSSEDMLRLPMVGRKPWPKVRVKKSSKIGGEERDVSVAGGIITLPMAPNPVLLKYNPPGRLADKNQDKTESNLVTWLPYASIDVVFNDKNLWANHQNHHPACITYDFDERKPQDVAKSKWEPKWVPFAEPLDKIIPVSPQVKLFPAMRASQVEHLRQSLREELVQTIMLHRQTKGMDTVWAQQDELIEQLELYLDIWELWFQLDIDSPSVQGLFNEDISKYKEDLNKSGQEKDDQKPDPSSLEKKQGGTGAGSENKVAAEGQQTQQTKSQTDETQTKKKTIEFLKETFGDDFKSRYCNVHGSPDFQSTDDKNAYAKAQSMKYQELEEKAGQFNDMKSWPVKRGMTFSGFPTHFSDPSPEGIRQYLLTTEKFLKCIEETIDEAVHTICCKIFALPGQVLSVWVYVGLQLPTKKDETQGA